MSVFSHTPTLQTRTSWIIGVLAIACIGLGLMGCGPTMAEVQSGPLPKGKSFAGKWYSPQYENMELEQKGDNVTGTFTYKEGGTISGTTDGTNVLRFDWEQPGDMSKARRAINGRGYLVLGADGDILEGEWGYAEDDTGGGVWTAERLGTRKDPGVDPDAPLFNTEDKTVPTAPPK